MHVVAPFPPFPPNPYPSAMCLQVTDVDVVGQAEHGFVRVVEQQGIATLWSPRDEAGLQDPAEWCAPPQQTRE